MANKRIQINYLNSDGSYDVLYPSIWCKSGSYIGTGTDNLTIEFGFEPDLFIVYSYIGVRINQVFVQTHQQGFLLGCDFDKTNENAISWIFQPFYTNFDYANLVRARITHLKAYSLIAQTSTTNLACSIKENFFALNNKNSLYLYLAVSFNYNIKL